MWTWDSGALAAGCWMAGSGPAGWQTFPKVFSGLFCSSLNFCHLLLFVLWLKVLVFESRVHVVSVKVEQGNRPHFQMVFLSHVALFQGWFHLFEKGPANSLVSKYSFVSNNLYTLLSKSTNLKFNNAKFPRGAGQLYKWTRQSFLSPEPADIDMWSDHMLKDLILVPRMGKFWV